MPVENAKFNLNDYLTAFRLMSDNLYSIAYLCDNNYNIIAVSQKFLDEFMIKSEKEILGTPFKECKIQSLEWYSNNYQILEEQFQEANHYNKAYITLDILDYEQISRMYIVHKLPHILGDGTKIFYVYLRPFGLPRLEDIIYYTNKLHLYSRPPNTVKYKLTPKQRMVLFLFLRNYSYSETSSWMSAFGSKMSSARVSEHLSALKNIFGAKDSNDLRKLAIQYGYHSEMPAGFLPNGSYCIHDYLTEINGFNDYPLQLSHLHTGYAYSSDSFINLSANEIMVFDNLMTFEMRAFHSFYAHTTEMAALITKAGKLLIATDKFIQEIGTSLDSLIPDIALDVHTLDATQANHFLEIMKNGKIYLLQKQLFGQDVIHIQLRKYVMPTIHRLMVDVFKVFALPKTNLPSNFRITERQHQILFFYARYYSYTQVSSILGTLEFELVPTTVNEHLNALKRALNVNSKDQLIDAALIIGYAIIPFSLLVPGSFKLINTDIHKWVC